MEGRMTEENITIALIGWLKKNGWKIICFDFPQSGTGSSLHPNEEIRTTKNKGSIIPDIVAIKGTTVVFFENKDRFVFDDFQKVEILRKTQNYSGSIKNLLTEYSYSKIFYGVGLPDKANCVKKANENLKMVDFSVFVSSDKSVSVKYQIASIFS
jgi:hypothetical protein